MKLVEINKFKKQHDRCFISWNRNTIKADGIVYKITYIKIGNKYFPYVSVPEIELKQPKRYNFRKVSKEDFDKIKKINENKDTLKRISYLVGNDEYYITGIGDYSIKAYKNNDDEPSYIWYNTNEGKILLNHLIGKIGQTKLAIKGEV